MVCGVGLGEERGRTKVRLLYSFERGSEAQELLKSAEQVDVATVQDNGVTDGKNCARFTFKRNVPWAVFYLGADAIRTGASSTTLRWTSTRRTATPTR